VTCRDVVPLVEAIAAGDVEATPDLRGHFDGCAWCASARRIDAALVAWPQADPPRDFASAVLARVRNERWTSEQRLDRIFNLAIAFALLVIAGSVAALTNIAGVLILALFMWGWAGRPH
jgi:hypothetical protein